MSEQAVFDLFDPQPQGLRRPTDPKSGFNNQHGSEASKRAAIAIVPTSGTKRAAVLEVIVKAGRRGVTQSRPGRKRLTPEHRANISAGLRANPMLGERHSGWRGDECSYNAAHNRAIHAHTGEPCSRKDGTCKGRLEVAFKHETPPEMTRIDPRTGCKYSPRPEHYMVLCRSHHTRYDGGSGGVNRGKTHCIHGHEFTPENTRISKTNGRCCRTCARERARSIRAVNA